MAILHGSWLLPSQQSGSDGGAYGHTESTSPDLGGLFLWGETWRRTPSLPLGTDTAETHQLAAMLEHPFAMSPAELMEFVQAPPQSSHLQIPAAALSAIAPGTAPKAKRRKASAAATRSPEGNPTSQHWQTWILGLPSYLLQGELEHPTTAVVVPQLATAPPEQPLFLYPWTVTGLYLPAQDAIAVLSRLPLGSVGSEDSFLGSDLRFWSHVARWSVDLLARTKFLPELLSISATEPKALAVWEPLLDSGIDQARLIQFSDRMPAACRTYQAECPAPSGTVAPLAFPLASMLPTPPQDLLRAFLQSSIDLHVRAIARQQTIPGAVPEPERTPAAVVPMPPLVQEWLNKLGQETAAIADPGLPSLVLSLETWTAPLQNRRADSLFRTCLYLHPPAPGQTDWTLEYGLQAADNPEFLISAPTIWNNPVERFNYRGRTIIQPQERFLTGLGLASRLYPPIEPSLQDPRPQFCSLNPLQAYDFIKTAAWRLQDNGLGVVMPPTLASQGGWANRLGLKIQAETGRLKKGQRLGLQSLLNFRWELTIGGQSLTKEEFDRLVALNTPLVEINGEWVELRPQDIRAAQTFFASRQDKPALSLEDALRISTGDTQMIEKLPVVSFDASGALEDLINTLNGRQTIEAIETPERFRGELRPYQSRGVGWLAFLERWGLGACLADDMGLGKTIELIAFLLHLQEQKLLERPILLICPTSVLGNWEREVKKFGPSLKPLVHHGDSRAKGKEFAKSVKDCALIITSYALVPRDLKDLQSVAWQGVVLDEAQNIKNSDAKQSQAVRQLDAQFRIALTGTPVENRLSELWSILDFLNPGYLGPKNFFQRRFATPIERYGDTDSLKTLRSLVQPFILRRLKTDKEIIQDLPEKQEMTVFCGLSAEQASLYQTVVEQSLADIEATEGIQRKGIILALLTKLKQICNHPALFLKHTESATTFQSRSGKLKRLEEMVEEVLAEGDRTLIFTQFAEWGKLLQAQLQQQLQQEVLFLYGSTSKKNREEMVDRFQHDPQGPRIFILSLKAGGVGLNLTRANHVFHFDRWWNPAVENQATDRVFRIGQTRNVQVHKFVCSGTLEEKIHDLIEGKKALAEQVVGAGENWLTELDTNQLRDLLLLDRSAIIGEE